jgi:two-component system sensor histidine kinase UhpB
VAQEALTNVARHSGSDEAELRLECDAGLLRLVLRDQGCGLAPGQIPGTGMRGMRERASLIGASLTVANRPVTGGCEVRLEVPMGALG